MARPTGRRAVALSAMAAAALLVASSTPAISAGLPGPRSATSVTGTHVGEVFLGGNYIELGLTLAGDFGTQGTTPDGFFGAGSRTQIGMSADHDGFDVGLDLAVDYFLPGGPEERFVVGYDIGGTTEARSAFARGNLGLGSAGQSSQLITEVADTSVLAEDLLRAQISSVWEGVMEVEQVVSFRADDKFFRNEVTITNTSGSNWDSARYMRSFDPDNAVDVGGGHTTSNVVTATVADDGFAAVAASTLAGNPLYTAFGETPIIFYSNDARAVASAFGFGNGDPYVASAYTSPRAKGDVWVADGAITLTWDSGVLNAGASRSFVYYTSLDDRDFDEVLADIVQVEQTQATPAPRSAPASDPRPVMDPGGGIPVVTPGASTGSVGGVPIVPTPARPDAGTAEFRVGTVETRLDVAVAGAGRVGGTNAAPVLEVVRDRVAQLTGGGMRPGGIAEVWMPLPDGGSRQVALLPIAADGTFDGALPFTGELDGRGPLPIGERTIQLFGTGADGRLTVINVGIRVEQPGPLAPEPERAPGAPPTLAPGQSLATVAGVPTRVTVTPVPDARSTRIAGDGWLMDVDVPEGTVRDEGGAPLIEIVNGTDSRVRGTGFMPGTRAYVWLMSDPTFLGEVTVGADGTFSGDVPIDGVAAGEHTLQLSGVGTDGYVRAANLGVVLVGDGMPRPTRIPAGDGPIGGTALSVLLALGLGLGLVGVGAVARGRRAQCGDVSA